MSSGGPLGPDGFDLYAPKNCSKAQDNVVAIAVAPRLSDGEAKSGRFSHEGKFGQLATMFAVEVGCMQ